MPLDPQTVRSDLTSQKVPTGTDLDTEEIRLFWTERRRNQAMFSARTTSTAYLERVKEVLQEYEDGVGEAEPQADKETITQGKARARMQMLEELQSLGIVEEAPGDSGRITDLASSIRLNLILETNAQVAHSLDMIQSRSDPVIRNMFPAWEFVRDEHRKEPRDWSARWQESANAVHWVGVARNAGGRMIALCDSPIWARLGSYDDGLGNPFPPFAFGSGMGVEFVDDEEWEDLK